MWWSCPREATAGPPCHFSPTASCCRTPQKVPWAGGNSSCLPLASCFLVISSADKHIRTRTVSLRWQARHYIASWGRKGGLCGEVEGGFGKGEELSGWIANRGWGGGTVWMAAWMDGRGPSWMDQTEDTTAAGPTERPPAGWAACLDKVTQTSSFLLWDGDKVELHRAFYRLSVNLFYWTCLLSFAFECLWLAAGSHTTRVTLRLLSLQIRCCDENAAFLICFQWDSLWVSCNGSGDDFRCRPVRCLKLKPAQLFGWRNPCHAAQWFTEVVSHLDVMVC